MNELATVADFAAKLGPVGILSIALYVLAKRHQALDEAYRALQEKRVTEAQANTQAMLAVAERVHASLERLDDLSTKR